MKVLGLHCNHIWYRVGTPSIGEDTSLLGKEWSCDSCVIILIHVEKEDEKRPNEMARRLRKFSIWFARLNDVDKIVLHSFAHLSESKADPNIARQIIEKAYKGIIQRGYNAHLTPFGYFLELKLHISDRTSSRVFKSL